MELVQMLVENLNVGEGQAEGGAGLIFQLAKSKLGDEDFAQIAECVPGLDTMLGSTPENSGSVAGALGGLASALGGEGSQLEALGNLASLAGGFSQLGLDEGAAAKFVPIILSFVQSQGGDGVKDLLAQVLQ